jgi:O-antigen ligase
VVRFPRRPLLERALQALVLAVVVTAVLSAGAILSWLSVARKLRWVALALLVLAALAYAWSNRRGAKPVAALVGAAIFAALALVSAAWSPRPELTLARGLAFAGVLAAAAALAFGGAARIESLRRILDALVASAGVVAVGGLLVLAFDHDRAIQPATTEDAARYQGLGGNPDTATMLLAVVLPLVAYAVTGSAARRTRLAAAAIAAVAAGSIVASGSRGALAAGCGGTVVYALLAPAATRVRLAAAAAVVAVAGVGFLITTLPEPERRAEAAVSSRSATTRHVEASRYLDANRYWRLQEDIGRPPWGSTNVSTHRTIFGTSGRAQAWDGALRLGAQRPLVGYGFGTENRVFVDRYVSFGSNLVENSYIGLFLQVGAIGLAAFVALVATLVSGLPRAARAVDRESAAIAAAAAGAVVAGLVLGLFQSYIYSPGNNATAAVWISGFLLAAATTRRSAAGS